jgi:uncharacterized protein
VAETVQRLDLGRLGLSPGEGRRLDPHVVVEPILLGAQHYAPDRPVAVRLDISRTTGGYALRLRSRVALAGPCMRCLEPAERTVPVDAREVHQPGGGEDLDSPYLEGDQLDLQAWARDALVLALPASIVCQGECRGLCAICGENLNTAGPEHAHEAEPDPRWAALRELRLE